MNDMDINRKIEEIRQKPEHIRVRYFWFMLTVSLFFVIFLWIFSMKENLSSIDNNSGVQSEITNQIKEEFSRTKSSINESVQTSSELVK
jgi:hypothetical protein